MKKRRKLLLALLGALLLCLVGTVLIRSILLHRPQPFLEHTKEAASIRISTGDGTRPEDYTLTIDDHFPDYLDYALENWGAIRMKQTKAPDKESSEITITLFDDSGRTLDCITLTEHGVTKKVSLFSQGSFRIMQGENPYELLKPMRVEKRIDLIQG